ncbi:MAG: hybrid sensor histidine kinase/response regulator [Planctomycetota bacterium]
MDATPRILVVDDKPSNVRLLRDLLGREGYEFIDVRTGEEALAAAAVRLPDLVLLDVLLPGMDGYRILSRMRADAVLQHIPVIMITALGEHEAKLRGIEAGADDFLTRPFDVEELKLRIRSLLRIKKLHDELDERYRKLAELEKNQELLVRMIVHDIRNPLTVIRGYLDLIRIQGGGTLPPRILTGIDRAGAGCRDLMRLSENLMDVLRFEGGAMPLQRRPMDLGVLMDDVRGDFTAVALLREVSLTPVGGAGAVSVNADPGVVKRMTENLVAGAVRRARTGGGVTLAVSMASDGRGAVIHVTDDGDPLPPEYHAALRDRFGFLNSPPGKKISADTGLGLLFCRLAAEAHGGRMDINEGSVVGNDVKVHLPVG